MKKRVLLVVLLIITAGLWGYNIGHLDVPQYERDTRLDGMEEIVCDDIIKGHDGVLRCEIVMQQEDDNIKIFKGIGAYDDRRY